jgi:4-carboxymuconolactone decarboxylase
MSRLPTLATDQLNEAQKAVHDRIASGTRGAVGGPFTVLLHSPELASRVEQLGVFIRYECSVPKRLRELAILVVGSHWKADYEWYAHAKIALGEGLSPAVVDAIGHGAAPPFDEEADRVVFAFCRELLRDGRVGDATYAPVQTLLGDTGAVELTGLVGYYTLLALQLNTFQVAAPSDGPRIPWAA